jgi:hypothetical protein
MLTEEMLERIDGRFKECFERTGNLRYDDVNAIVLELTSQQIFYMDGEDFDKLHDLWMSYIPAGRKEVEQDANDVIL